MDLPLPDPSILPSAAAVDAGVFQHYRVLRRPDGTPWELGRGAMGVTYKALDENLRVPVALKVVSPHALLDDTARARFVREARAAARLRHRHVAAVHHLGQDEGGGYFYAMEFVDGETLEHHVRHHGPLPPGRALAVVGQIARALGAAHREGLVHRDIKPANVMILPDEDEEGGLLVKVIDFGLARAAAPGLGMISGAASGGLSGLTQAGFVGTPLFASPEQLEERTDVDIRSDIYSVGVTLWYLLTARPPFTGSLAGIISQHLTREPPWEQLEARGTGALAPALRGLLALLLEKDRERRPADPAALRRALETCRRALPPDPVAPGLPDPAGGTSSSSSPAVAGGRALLAGRYRLDTAVGEGSAGRVFRARDLGRGGIVVAVKVFHADLFAADDTGEGDLEETLAGLAGRVRLAGHPNLLAVGAFGREGVRRFLVSEWLRGFSVDALLRRRGVLAADDALCLLDQVAAAFDHARRAGLPARRLELGVHGVMVHFPAADAGNEPVEVPAGPLRNWPLFAVKVDPLGIGREAGDPLLTWAGDRTLVPALTTRRPARDTQSSIRGLAGESPAEGMPDAEDPAADLGEGLRGLGALAYALFGGTPGGTTNLPTLGESANAVLRRVRRGEGAAVFGTAAEFVGALREGAPAAGEETVIGTPPPAPTVRPPARLTRPRTVAAVPGEPSPFSPPATTAPVEVADAEALPAEHETASIAHFIDDPAPSGARTAVLAALVLLGLAGLVTGGLWWGVPALRRMVNTGMLAAEAPRPKPAATTSPAPRPRPTPVPAATPPALKIAPAPTPPLLPPVAATPRPAPTPVASTPAPTTPTPTPAGPPERRVPVRFTSEPAGAEITLRGELLGLTPLPTTLPPGEYTARARYGDWPEATRTFRVPARGVTSVDVPFRLRPPGADTTTVLQPDALPETPREQDAPGPVRRSPRPEDAPPETTYPDTPALPAIPVETGGER